NDSASVLFLLLFFCAGFTQDKPSIPKPTNVIECICAGGICFGICLSPFRPIGTCDFRVPCCEKILCCPHSGLPGVHILE
uniref:Beta-defensin-like domain-containing protein n=1 Tax=Terrapene triunguis TaxID=2587831 RepID=A0A674J521_9SAUR